jgi:hypothetical protein
MRKPALLVGFLMFMSLSLWGDMVTVTLQGWCSPTSSCAPTITLQTVSGSGGQTGIEFHVYTNNPEATGFISDVLFQAYDWRNQPISLILSGGLCYSSAFPKGFGCMFLPPDSNPECLVVNCDYRLFAGRSPTDYYFIVFPSDSRVNLRLGHSDFPSVAADFFTFEGNLVLLGGAVEITSIPEPSTILLLTAGVSVLAVSRRYHR